MAHEGLHEPFEKLSARTRDMHRAIISLQEELEAVDWYQQRIDACEDPELRRILEHNRDEEKEHAAMVLEWIRRHDVVFSRNLKTYLNTRGDIIAAEDETERRGADESKGSAGAMWAAGSPAAGLRNGTPAAAHKELG